MERIPTRWRLAWVSVLALVCLAAATSFTKDDAIRMARTGQSEQAILDAIRESHATFDLTANDIAELRQSGVTDKVIEAMTEASPAPSEATQEAEEQAQPDQSNSDEGVQEQPLEPEYYPAPPPIAYPVYPLYYPVYYPVYDLFFPYFGGFFAFEFVHVSRAFTVFPCDRAVVVVNRTIVPGRTFFRGAPAVSSAPRVTPRGNTGISQARQFVRGDPNRLRGGGATPRPPSLSSVPMRPPRYSTPTSARPMVGPRGSPMARPRGAPSFPTSRPNFQASPQRPPAPAFHRPMTMPHGFSVPMGGGMNAHAFGGSRPVGSGHGHGVHH